MVVVLPVPLTPTTRITLGRSCTCSTGGSPKSAATSSARPPMSPRCSSRRTSSAVAGTPTSACSSASSSRSQDRSSPGSKAAAASCSVSARRDFDSESRRRENTPARSASGSGAASASPSSSPQLRSADGFGFVARQAARDDLRDAVAAHRDAVEHVGGFHRALLVCDDHELRAVRVLPQQRDEAPDVRVVECRLDLVQQIERARPREEERKEERDRAERLLAARQERQPLHTLAGRAQLDGLGQFLSQLLELLQALLEIGALRRQLVEPFLLGVVLLFRERVHLAERLAAAVETLRALGEHFAIVAFRALVR